MNLYDKYQFPKLSGIYRIYNKENNKSYIGSAVNLKKRLQRHYYELIKQNHRNIKLQRSYNKYGVDAFNIEILETFNYIEYEELLNIEKKYILKYDSINNGYNILYDYSSFISNLNKSKKHIDNNIRKTSKPVYMINIFTNEIENKFKSVSDCAKLINTSSTNISQICKNRKNRLGNYTFCYVEDYLEGKDYRKNLSKKGKKLSEEHKRNLKKANQLSSGKKVYKYDLNYNFIIEYPSMLEAERQNNLKKESLRYKIDKKTPFGGFYWLSAKF